MNTEIQNTPVNFEKEIDKVQKIEKEVKKVIIGQQYMIDRILIGLFCNGHILLEGVPGLAKTAVISTLSKTLSLKYKRIQFTPDLLPSDLIGSVVYNKQTGDFHVKKGPVFTNLLLADEINRAPAKVQSALLESMQERQVTIGDETHKLPKPFFVMATQNPIEQEGTYQLPEAQIDRFLLKAIITYPSHEDELKIMDNNTSYGTKKEIKEVANIQDIEQIQKAVRSVYVDESIKEYIANIIRATRNPKKHLGEKYENLFGFGASPRGSIALFETSKAVAFMNNRNYVIPEDVKEIVHDVLRHRIILTYEAEAENITTDTLIDIVLEHVPVP